MSETNIQLEDMEAQESSIDYGKLFNDLLKHKRLFYKPLGVAFVLSVIVSLSIPNYYKCEVTLSPEMSKNSSTVGLAALASNFGVNLKGMGGATDALFPTIYPDLMNSVKFKTGLFQIPVTIEGDEEEGIPDTTMTYYDYLKNEQKKAWWTAAISATVRGVVSLFVEEEDDSLAESRINPFRLTEKQAKIVKLIDEKIVCDVDQKTMMISIEVTDQDPVICATMADSVKERLQKAITDYRTNKARVDLAYYQTVLEEAKGRYDKACADYAKFSDGNQKLFLQGPRLERAKLEDEMNLRRGVVQQVYAQLQQAEMLVQQETPAFTTLSNATVPIEKAGPGRKKIVLVFLFLAFIGTAAWVLHKENDLKLLLGLGS